MAEGKSSKARGGQALDGTLYRTVGLVFLLALIFSFFGPISHVVLLGFTGVIIGMAFNKLVVLLPVPRVLGTAIVGLSTFAAIGFLFWLIGSAVAAQVRAFIDDFPAIVANLEGWVEQLGEALGVELELAGAPMQEVLRLIRPGAIISGTLGVLEVLAIFLLLLMGAFFVVAKPNEQLLTPLIRAVPPGRRPAYRRMFYRLGDRLSGWMIGTVLDMLVVGILTGGVLALLGIPYSILLGVITGVLSIVPIIGAWIGGIIAVVVTLFGAPGMVLWVIISMVAIQEIEGNLIRPYLMAGAAEVHPFVTLMSLLLFSSIFGIIGAILALPITLALGTMVEVLWVEETLGAGDDEIEPVVDV
jgi:predicted PurR-regulated permease PerM